LNTLGRHLVADFHGCTADLNDPQVVMGALEQACEIAGATIVDRSGHHFSPYGVTAVIVIAESHLAVHTWPEYGYAAVDLFTCGTSVDTWKAFEFVKSAFGATRVEVREFQRGLLSEAEIRAAESYGSAAAA
jgi:S-adenosylmethionine decarboxylase proenzyme